MYYSFVILKPDALKRNLVSLVMHRFKNAGINIEHFTHTLIDENLIFEHYSEVIEKLGESFKLRAKKSFVGECVIPVIIASEDENIIANVRKLIGNTDPSKADKGTIRGDFANDNFEASVKEERCRNNIIHASDSIESYTKEVALWFGKDIAQKYSYNN